MRILDWIENTKTVVMSFSKKKIIVFFKIYLSFFYENYLVPIMRILFFIVKSSFLDKMLKKPITEWLRRGWCAIFLNFLFRVIYLARFWKLQLKITLVTPKICSEMFKFYENILIEIMTRWICSENINFMFSSRAQWSLTEFTKLSEIKCALNCEIFFQTFIVLLT